MEGNAVNVTLSSSGVVGRGGGLHNVADDREDFVGEIAEADVINQQRELLRQLMPRLTPNQQSTLQDLAAGRTVAQIAVGEGVSTQAIEWRRDAAIRTLRLLAAAAMTSAAQN